MSFSFRRYNFFSWKTLVDFVTTENPDHNNFNVTIFHKQNGVQH